MKWRIGLVAAIAAAALGLPLAARQSGDLFKTVVYREIGPTRQGGRFVDFAVVESDSRIFYAATATGGLYKTESHGISFASVFDNQPVASLGAVAVSASNPGIVYVGTGEGNNSRSSYWGNGVYVSRDAGRTWTHAGLTDSHHIGRILVHPTDPNTAYVAALGHLYSENQERGLFKTTDGGRTWTKSLALKSEGKDVGVVDVAMDPKNPSTLYAAAYEKVRRPWTFGEGGPGSGLYKSVDAGKTWTRLAGGLPAGVLGRIGVAVSRQDPNTVYAIVENVNQTGVDPDTLRRKLAEGFGSEGGGQAQLYRSDDAGRTWRQVAPAPGATPPAGRTGGAGSGGFDGGSPAYYYGQVRVDPNDKEHVFVLSVGASQSRDGGRTWSGLGAGGDNHALWIDPKDSKHMLLGYDHGMSLTFDGGQSWSHVDTLPTAQAYAVGFDMATPYNVYTGLQDNGSQRGPSTRKSGGSIPFEDWSTVGGGDGQYNVVDWKDSRYLYNESQFGAIARTDLWTGQTKNIQYRPAGREPLRYNWTAPILVSPHDADTVYFAANVVLRSINRGESWEEISPDLSVNEAAKRGGGGNITYATITTLDESPVVPGLLWAGTDDGNVQVTKDGGKSWTNVRDRIPGHPGYWVSRVEASHLSASTAYATMTGLRNDDFRPFIWRTTDFGQSWTSIAGNLPDEAINVVREDPRNPSLLFAGTDLSVQVSLDAGKSWSALKGSAAPPAPGGGARGGRGGAAATAGSRGVLPAVPVHDLKIHPRDRELIVGTHGRGIFIADISPYEELTAAVLASDTYLFEISPVIQWMTVERGSPASTNFAGMSRPADMGISYYLKTEASGDVKVRVYDGGRVIADLDGPKTPGVNTVRWNLQTRRERIPGEPGAPAGRGGRGAGGLPGAGAAQACDPGFVCAPARPAEYRVELSAGGRDYVRPARILPDPAVR